MRAAVLLVLLTAGCVATAPPPPASTPATTTAPVVREAAPTPAPEVVAPAAAPGPCPLAADGLGVCLRRTGFGGAESTVGVCAREGAVFASPAIAREGATSITRAAGEGLAVARSLDDGATWTLVAPQVNGRNAHAFTLDPYLYVDPATCRVFFEDLATGNCGILSWSDDLGATWDTTLSGCMAFDHQTIFAGPPRTSAPRGYPNVVYRCAVNLVATADAGLVTSCQKSLDGGLTWIPTRALPFAPDPMAKGNFGVRGYCDGGVGHGVVDATGRVWLPKGWCGMPYVATSDDEGDSWRRVRVADLGMAVMAEGPHEHEAAIGVDAAGNAYYGWIARDRLPYVATSIDGGATWGAPIPLAPAGLKEAALPSLAVAPDGTVAFAYYGSFDSPGPPARVPDCEEDPLDCPRGALEMPDMSATTWGGHVALVQDALTPTPRVRTAVVNETGDPLVRGACGPVRCQSALDFQDVQFGPDGSAWAAFVDVDGGAELVVARVVP